MRLYPETEEVSFHMDDILYDELFECEVEPYDATSDDVPGSQFQFIQGMLCAEKTDGDQVYVHMSNDGLEHLLRRILPDNLERWYSSLDSGGEEIITSAQRLLSSFGFSCPY